MTEKKFKGKYEQMEALAGEEILKRVAPEAARQLSEAIGEAGGNEVFFAGALDPAGRIGEARVCARGNESAVTALFETLNVRDVVIHNHPGGDLRPSEADLELASVYSTHGHGVYIIDNEVTRVYVVVEPFLPEEQTPLELDELQEFLSPSGPLARRLPGFEVRQQQHRMMARIAHAFNQDGLAVIEAPTGVGKTLSYLLPAARWAMRNRERVVISTRTINLQEQIVFKDIPLLQRCLDETFSACLVKGRSNYICLRRLNRAFAEAELFEDQYLRDQLVQIAEWAEKTEDGSKADLQFVPAREIWERVCSEGDTCGMSRCPDQKKCFVTRARRQVAKADLIVVNHHMLFSDLAIKMEAGDFTSMAILPAYRRLIFDEAHSIEDSATEYFGVNATRLGALNTFGRFYRMDRGRERGLLPLIRLRLMRDCPFLPVKEFESIQEFLDAKLLPSLSVARTAAEAAFSALRELAACRCGQIGGDIKWRLTEKELAEEAVRRTHRDFVMPAVDGTRRLAAHAGRLLRILRELNPPPDAEEPPLQTEIMQLRAYTGRLERMANALAESTSEELAENTVRWIEISARNDKLVRVVRCPLEVGGPLAESLYDNMKTVVMTSATLAVRQRFDYLCKRLGLDRADQDRLETEMLDSPFDFANQALLCVTGDVVPPNDKGFLDESAECVRRAIRITKGSAFVLFTSFYALDYTWKKLEKELRALGITPLRQGETTRTRLLDRFRRDTASVLFATDSFWEGVDVAGESLQCVILPKLPFRVPTEPIQEARAEAIEAAGGNPFMEYSVPQAVMKFRQGFGRLIRRQSDRGVILVLDQRMITKYYGKIFLESIPEVRVIRGPKKGIFTALEKFFNREEAEVSSRTTEED
jgi:ATP-dependent DNA helicase DinG